MKLVLVLGIVMLVAGPALAQQGGFGNQITRSALLGQESVVAELKLSEDQSTKIKEARDKESQARRELFKMGGFKPTEETRKKMQELTDATNKTIEEVLNKDQLKRLNEIHIQALERFSGMYGALRYGPGVPEALNISDELKGKIQDVQDEYQKQVGELFKGGFKKGGFEETRKKMEEARKNASDKILGLLSDTQKAKFNELKGAEFKGELNFGPRKPTKPTKPATEED